MTDLRSFAEPTVDKHILTSKGVWGAIIGITVAVGQIAGVDLGPITGQAESAAILTAAGLGLWSRLTPAKPVRMGRAKKPRARRQASKVGNL